MGAAAAPSKARSIFNEARAKRVKRVKRIEWNKVSLVVDVAVCSHFAGFIARARLARFARSPGAPNIARTRLVGRVGATLADVVLNSSAVGHEPLPSRTLALVGGTHDRFKRVPAHAVSRACSLGGERDGPSKDGFTGRASGCREASLVLAHWASFTLWRGGKISRPGLAHASSCIISVWGFLLGVGGTRVDEPSNHAILHSVGAGSGRLPVLASRAC